MTNQPSFEELKAFFAADRFAMDNGIVILEATPGYARCTCPILPQHFNAGGTVQGGMLFTLADFTFAVAANASGIPTVTLDSTISFLQPAKGKELTAIAREIQTGKTICRYQVEITDDLGTKVAILSATGFQKR
ncbi:MAG: PaaI family thioesterase [Peptococcaceae bacterium]|jgi:acyl-CoA thioesterase|nr:PaaI family thioesterase [Peptococcaceae bacterium]